MTIYNNRNSNSRTLVTLRFLILLVIFLVFNFESAFAGNIRGVRRINNQIQEVYMSQGSLLFMETERATSLLGRQQAEKLPIYLIQHRGNHFKVRSKNRPYMFYDSIGQTNGAASQALNTCLLNATDNYFYLNTIGPDSSGRIHYSEFSRRLHGNKYIRLFYITLEMYEIGKYDFNDGLYIFDNGGSLDWRLNLFLDDINKARNNDLIDNQVEFKQAFKDLFRSYGLDNTSRDLLREEFEEYMYRLFTDIKHELGLEGNFNPDIDTPHLVQVFDDAIMEYEQYHCFEEDDQEFADDDNFDIGFEYTEYVKHVYNLTKKIPNDFSYINNVEKDGGYVTLGYNNGFKYDNSNVINFSIGYEGSDKGILRYGTNLVVGNTTLKDYTETSNSDINYLSLIGYMKLKLKMLDISSGFFARNFFEGNNLKRDFKTGTGNYSFGYFVGLHKKMEFFGKNYFRIYSTLFGTDNKLNNTKMFGNESFNSSISYKNLYAENAIELSLEYLTIDGVHLSFIPALKYDSYINNKNRTTYILAKDFDRTISIKNDDKPYVSLQNKITFPCDYIFSLGADFTEDNNIFYVNFSKSF